MDPDRLRLYGQILNWVALMAGIAATAFPVLYAFSTWNDSTLGRAMMYNSIVTAFLLDTLVVSRFGLLGSPASLIAFLVGLALIACTKTGMCVMMWTINHRKENKDERVRSEA